jgi:lipopolysaccharide/colanic/teichoic acid biosynthesis glycosyltransferase
MMKTFFDLIVSVVALLATAPLFLLSAVLIKLESKGPVFYRGLRVGRHGKPFRIFKFRSMIEGAESMGASSTNANDTRITKVGKLIRAFKLDEFAQLINVVKGDMSFVGPRPEVRKFTDLYTDEEKIILAVRPGITDWASIKFHNEPEIIAASGISDADEAYAKLIRPEKLRLQMKYVKERNFFLDIWIIVATLLTLFSTRLGGGAIGIPRDSQRKRTAWI